MVQEVSDPCFTLSVVDEFELTAACLCRVHSAYPEALVRLIVDGPEQAAINRWMELGQSLPHTRVTAPGRGLYPIDRGGLVVQTHLEAFLASGASWWCKIDPDTWVRRRLERLPVEPCFFGTIQGGIPRPSLQGGCIGGTRAAAERVLASGVLDDPALLDFRATWAAGNAAVLRRAEELGLVSFDYVHAWAAERAGVPVVDHPEIRSYWRKPPIQGHRFAITHPHKDLDEPVPQDPGSPEELRLNDAVRALIDRTTPTSTRVDVISRGDPELLHVPDRDMRHFPADEEGRYSACHPADSVDAVRQLTSAMSSGLRYLVVPEPSRWWLGYYPDFATFLATQASSWVDEPGVGVVWRLNRSPR